MNALINYILLLTGGFLALALFFFFIERRFPRWKARDPFSPGWRTDFAHYFLTNILVWLISIFLVYRIVQYVEVPAFLHPFRSAVASAPLWVNLLILVFVQDFVQYWVHRAFHHFPVLWKFHAIHHSSTQMDWLANARDHPVDQLSRRLAITFVLALLGLSEEAFAIFVTIIGPAHTYLVHANVRLGIPWLDYIVVTPNYHHWHHAIAPKDKNFAGRFPVLDLLFGTFYCSRTDAVPVTGCDQAIPEKYFGQLKAPFLGNGYPAKKIENATGSALSQDPGATHETGGRI